MQFNPIPRLLEPAHFTGDTSMRGTPDMSAEINDRLRLEDPSSETETDDSMSTTDLSSEWDESHGKPPRGLPTVNLPTGLCYDSRMRYHAEPQAPNAESVHPEDPQRITKIYEELLQAGLVDDKNRPEYPPCVERPLYRIEAREATVNEILLIHEQKQFDDVQQTSSEFSLPTSHFHEAD
jgi:histone deacetylase 6